MAKDLTAVGEIILPGAFGGEKTVPLTVYIKDGHLVNPGEGEKFIIGEAIVEGTQISLTLTDRVPDAVMDSLIGMTGAKFSIGFNPEVFVDSFDEGLF